MTPEYISSLRPQINRGFHIFMDGNMWCAVGPHFENIQESPCGFGPTPSDALNELNHVRERRCESPVHLFNDNVKMHHPEHGVMPQ